jgi:hypothetical protein
MVKAPYLVEGGVVMATKTSLIDDLNGEEGAETMRFARDSDVYEIDLTPPNRARFDSALAEFIAAARPVETAQAKPRAAKKPKHSSSLDSAAIRVWASSQGIFVRPQGRIAASVVSRYEKAQNGSRTAVAG